MQAGLQSYAGPGHWNDPDMLEVGNGGMTDTEYRSHFSLWAILAAPLIAGNDLRNMRPEIHDILTNKEVIAVDQDALGHEGERVANNGDFEVWAKQLKDGSRAVVLLNGGGAEQQDRCELGGSRLSRATSALRCATCGSTKIWESSQGNSRRRCRRMAW